MVFDGDLLDRRAHFQPRSAKRAAGATEGSGVHANPLWISPTDGAIAARELAGKYQTGLPTVQRRRAGGADGEAVQESGPDANPGWRKRTIRINDRAWTLEVTGWWTGDGFAF
jgi:hypothetical protein